MTKYSKFIASFVAVAGAVGFALADGHITGIELGTILTTVAAAGAVFTVPNKGA